VQKTANGIELLEKDFADSDALSDVQKLKADSMSEHQERKRSLEATITDAARPHAPEDSNRTSLGLVMARMIHKGVAKHRIAHMNPIGRDVEYHGLYEEALTFPIRRPWATNLLIATSKTFCADLIVQVSSRSATGARRFDWRRSLLFTTFGFLYVGMAQWFFYISLFSRLCPEAMTFASESLAVKLTDTVGQEDLAIQVIVDQFIISPFIYFPIFYILKEFLHRCLEPRQMGADDDPNKADKVKDNRPLVMRAMSNYGGNFWVDNLLSLSIWLPADIFIFMVPMVMRMPLDHAVAFVWTMILSVMRGAAK